MQKVITGVFTSYFLSIILIFVGSIIDIINTGGKALTAYNLSNVVSAAFMIFPAVLAGSIVCTLGVSLIVLIPLFWLIGTITLAIFPNIAYQNRQASRNETLGNLSPQRVDTLSQAETSLTKQQIALIEYMRKGNSYGWSDTQIASRLKAQGWKDEEIAEAQRLVNS